MLDAPGDNGASRWAADAAAVLLIDDDRPFLNTLAGLVGMLGWHSIAAEDGLTGLALYRRHRPAVVLVDVLMPGLDGIETIVQLRRISHGVKIAAMSGGGEIGKAECLATAIRFGADVGLQKPFDRATLARVLQTLLHSRRPARLSEVAGAIARLSLLATEELAR